MSELLGFVAFLGVGVLASWVVLATAFAFGAAVEWIAGDE